MVANCRNAWSPGGDILPGRRPANGVGGNSKKKKRLQAAIQAEGPKKKVAVATRGPGMPSPIIQARKGALMPFRQPPMQIHANNFRTGVCHRCGQSGHYVKFCPQQSSAMALGRQAMQR